MGNSASSQESSAGTHEDVGTSILEEQHDWPIEQAAAIPDTQSLQEMQNPYTHSLVTKLCAARISSPSDVFFQAENAPRPVFGCGSATDPVGVLTIYSLPSLGALSGSLASDLRGESAVVCAEVMWG